MAIDRSQCCDALPPRLRHKPLAIFDDSKDPANLDLVWLCLEAYIALSFEKKKSKQAARTYYDIDKPGSKALQWLLETGLDDSLDFLANARFVMAMTHCLVAEKQEEFIWKWVTSTKTPAFAKGETRSTIRVRWKALLVRQLVEAQAFWCKGPNILLDSFDTYFRALAPPDPELGYKRGWIPLVQVGVWLGRQLCSTAARHVPIDVHDKFAAYMPWQIDPDVVAYERGCLALFHPTGPDPGPALAFFRGIKATAHSPSVYAGNLFDPKQLNQAYQLYWLIIRTAQALHQRGDVRDARGVLDFGRARLPGLFSGKKYVNLPNTKDDGSIGFLKDQFAHRTPEYSRLHKVYRYAY
ncbi:hypothetical protein LTR97_003411 [Elasticomyces elasticus]|uniref:Uncharacterized protein n=1 Tax=Elasticomyces elasticus TaxID=574655 RepID=A0AAN8A433_9PEZI|nr:hypothetical protein LTR97_003411 [Elasticomyces elasticus]